MCNICNGAGVIPYYKEINNTRYQYFAGCYCKAGEDYRHILPPVEIIFDLNEVRVDKETGEIEGAISDD